MSKILEIPKTLEVISDCWRKAEAEVCRRSKNMPCSYEETITETLCCELKASLEKASDDKLIEKAFSRDLRKYEGCLSKTDSNRISRGLIAEVSYHNKTAEKSTGGDMGLVITRPKVCRDRFEEHRHGLLCQAKRRDKNRNWNTLTDKQKAIFDPVPDYLALLLYSFAEGCDKLDSFRWQLCKGFTLAQIKTWTTKAGVFPNPLCSEELITQLGRGKIGTDDIALINKKILPAKSPILQVRVWWPEEPDPKSESLLRRVRESALSNQDHQHISAG